MRSRNVDTIQQKPDIVRIKKNVVVNKADVKIKSNSKKVPKDVIPCDELSDVEDCDDINNVSIEVIDEDGTLEPIKCIYGGSQRKLCSSELCMVCYNKSFASSNRVKSWSKKNIVNPRDVCLSSQTKYLFNCNICKHEITTSPDAIKRRGMCVYCAKQRICLNDSCQHCTNLSFASSKKAFMWSKKNNILSREVFKSSNSKKYLFDCNVCNHTFQNHPYNVDNPYGKGNGCPYCGKKLLCSNDACKICFDRSFASIHTSKYWSKKNKIKPREVFKSSAIKFIFNCEICGHEFKCRLDNIKSRNQSCTCTQNKTESKLKNWIIENKYDFIPQIKYDWCKNLQTNRHLPFDFVIEPLKIIIELDGPQHFKQISNWDTPEKIMNTDVYKMKCAIDNGYTIIRLLQVDVHNNKNNWENKLKKCIDIRILEKKLEKHVDIRNKKSYYFLCANHEYLEHEILLNIALLKN